MISATIHHAPHRGSNRGGTTLSERALALLHVLVAAQRLRGIESSLTVVALEQTLHLLAA
jgi:hypothetical protein